MAVAADSLGLGVHRKTVDPFEILEPAVDLGGNVDCEGCSMTGKLSGYQNLSKFTLSIEIARLIIDKKPYPFRLMIRFF